jgi:hypothetical protein
LLEYLIKIDCKSKEVLYIVETADCGNVNMLLLQQIAISTTSRKIALVVLGVAVVLVVIMGTTTGV